MLDVFEVIEDGLNPARMAAATEAAMIGLERRNSPESKWLLKILESFRDSCESHNLDE